MPPFCVLRGRSCLIPFCFFIVKTHWQWVRCTKLCCWDSLCHSRPGRGGEGAFMLVPCQDLLMKGGLVAAAVLLVLCPCVLKAAKPQSLPCSKWLLLLFYGLRSRSVNRIILLPLIFSPQASLCMASCQEFPNLVKVLRNVIVAFLDPMENSI